jgi:HAMP domain-containing protein
VSRGRDKRRQSEGGGEKYTRPEGAPSAQRRSDAVLDSNEVERQNALQVQEAAERAGSIVSDEVEAIMQQAEANADEIRRNAAQDADNLRSDAADTGSRVAERIEALSGALGEHVDELRREVDALQSGTRRET